MQHPDVPVLTPVSMPGTCRRDGVLDGERSASGSEEWYRAILENSTDAITVLSMEGVVVYASPAAHALSGYEPQEFVGTPVLSWVHPDDRSLVKGVMAAALSAPGTRHVVETRTRTRHRGYLATETSGHFVESLAGEPAFIINTRDVTERRQTQARDALLHDLTQQIIQAAPLEQLLGTACTRLVRLFDASGVWIGLWSAHGGLALGAAAGPATEQRLRALSWPLILSPAESTPTHCCQAVERVLETAGLPPALVLPLGSDRRQFGVLGIHAPEGGRIDASLVRSAQQISSHVHMALRVAEDQQHLRLQGTAMEMAPNPILLCDREGRIDWVNAAFSRLTGYAMEEIKGQTPRILKSGRHDRRFYEQLWATILAGRIWQGEVVNRRRDGTFFVVNQSIVPLQDRTGAVTHFVALHEDITSQKEAEARMMHLVQHDGLTGLPNRALLRDRLLQAMARARRRGQLAALLFLDLDRFKFINDTLGHKQGDELLIAVGARLARCVRREDTIARLGGDEFTVLLPDLADVRCVIRVAESVLEALGRPFEIDGHEVFVTASIGVVVYPADADDADALLKNADVAMYRAKQQGGNSYAFFTAEMHAQMQERLRTEQAMRRAVQQRDFELHYQPYLRAATGEAVGVEALVRWRRPDLGLLLPSQFIPIAEESGLIVGLGEWILQTACAQARHWTADLRLPLRVSVNLSARQFLRPELIDRLLSLITGSGIDPSRLEIELTEGIFSQDISVVAQALGAFKALGIRIAIDDFGTGYSSLGHLKRLPIDTLKIDQSFVRDLTTDADDLAIVTAIVAMGRTLKMEVLAEGVETEEQRRLLVDLGCDLVQGHLHQEPMPAREVPAWFERAARPPD